MKNILAVILATLTLSVSVVANGQTERLTEDSTPLNLLPMYGYPDREKPDDLKKSDEAFIEAATAEHTREEASDHFAAKGWELGRKGDYATAMTRFNQAWLLNPDSYKPYWGFGIILKQQENLPEAVTHFEKALSLMNQDQSAKRDLLIETARTHMFLGVLTRTNSTDMTESDGHFGRANELFDKTRTQYPQYTGVPSLWAQSLYWEGDYAKAWEMVNKARSLGHDCTPEFIESLSRKMPEPKPNDL